MLQIFTSDVGWRWLSSLDDVSISTNYVVLISCSMSVIFQDWRLRVHEPGPLLFMAETKLLNYPNTSGAGSTLDNLSGVSGCSCGAP